MDSWQATSVIKQKVFNPSKRLVICEQGIEDLYKEKYKYDEFLKKFRSRLASKVKRDVAEVRGLRGSFADSRSSHIGDNPNFGLETPRNKRLSVSSLPSQKYRSLEKVNSSRSLIKRTDGEADQNKSAKWFTTLRQNDRKEFLQHTSGEISTSTKLFLKYKPGEYTLPPKKQKNRQSTTSPSMRSCNS